MNDSTLLVGILTITITLIIDIINRIKSVKDNEPQLSFDLRNFDDMLFLIIKNTGHTKATNIKINIKKIWNNSNNGLNEDFIFSVPFELNSNEQTQGMIAFCGDSIYEHTFPYIDIEVSYYKQHFIKKVKYDRQVFFNPQQEDKSMKEICNQIKSLNNNIDKLRNPILRLANYFDGHQIAPFDELNILAKNSFQSDLYDVLNNKKNKIINRKECIDNNIINKH